MDPSRQDALAARAARPTTPKGTLPGPAKRLVTAAFPVFYALNRPSHPTDGRGRVRLRAPLERDCDRLPGALMPLPRYDVKRCEIYVTQNIVALPRT